LRKHHIAANLPDIANNLINREVFLHHNLFNNDIYLAFVRRCNRLLNLIDNNNKIVFIYYNCYTNDFDDILNNGLQSGIISELIYYKDTLAFYKKYQSEIVGLLNEAVSSSGMYTEDLFGNKWDKQDPFALETNNRNLLTWFAFEEITRQLDNILY
jgi:hypothetical protein